MPIYVPGKLTLRQTYIGTDDPDAAAYIAAVEAADEIASPGVGGLETATKVAIHSFVKGCKADGIWPAIKAGCILAGAKTLAGALVPLVGAAPSNDYFVAGDYNRKTGLKGNATDKRINTNYSPTAANQDNNHALAWVTEAATGGSGLYPISFGNGAANTPGSTHTSRNQSNDSRYFLNSTSSADLISGAGSATGLVGSARNNASNYFACYGSTTQTVNRASNGSSTQPYYAFHNGSGVANLYSDERLAFYSGGDYLDPDLLRSRVADLINAIGVAIP